MSLRNYRTVLHPSIQVQADGWHSTVGELTRHGWLIEAQDDPCMRRTVFYMRNPSKYMTGCCYITEEAVQMVRFRDSIVAYMDERVIMRAELYKEMSIPKAELYTMDVAEPICSPDMMMGKDYEWRIYNGTNSETEIIVTPEKVPFLLEEIRKAQEPRAKEIIHSEMRREAPEIITQAKILSFG